jgi:hypothetical protein
MLIFSPFSVRFKWSLNSAHLSDPAFREVSHRTETVEKKFLGTLRWDAYLTTHTNLRSNLFIYLFIY